MPSLFVARGRASSEARDFAAAGNSAAGSVAAEPLPLDVNSVRGPKAEPSQKLKPRPWGAAAATTTAPVVQLPSTLRIAAFRWSALSPDDASESDTDTETNDTEATPTDSATVAACPHGDDAQSVAPNAAAAACVPACVDASCASPPPAEDDALASEVPEAAAPPAPAVVAAEGGDALAVGLAWVRHVKAHGGKIRFDAERLPVSRAAAASVDRRMPCRGDGVSATLDELECVVRTLPHAQFAATTVAAPTPNGAANSSGRHTNTNSGAARPASYYVALGQLPMAFLDPATIQGIFEAVTGVACLKVRVRRSSALVYLRDQAEVDRAVSYSQTFFVGALETLMGRTAAHDADDDDSGSGGAFDAIVAAETQRQLCGFRALQREFLKRIADVADAALRDQLAAEEAEGCLGGRMPCTIEAGQKSAPEGAAAPPDSPPRVRGEPSQPQAAAAETPTRDPATRRRRRG